MRLRRIPPVIGGRGCNFGSALVAVFLLDQFLEDLLLLGSDLGDEIYDVKLWALKYGL